MTTLTTLPPGFHVGVPIADYLALPMASATTLHKIAHQSPWHAHQGRSEQTTAMSMGSLLHALILEPATVAERFYVFEGDKRSNAKKAEWENAESTGLQVVREADFEAATVQAEQVRAAAGSLLSRVTHAEVTLIWQEGDTLCKARPDGLLPEGLLDLKRSRSGHHRAFLAACARYGTHYQAAWYFRGARALGLPRDEWHWIVAEIGGPVTLYKARPNDLLAIEIEVERALARYVECVAADSWPGYEGGFLELGTLLASDLDPDDIEFSEENDHD